jgi:hypothetical protein
VELERAADVRIERAHLFTELTAGGAPAQVLLELRSAAGGLGADLQP